MDSRIGNTIPRVQPVYRVILTEKDREQARRDREQARKDYLERISAQTPNSEVKKLVKTHPGAPTGKSWQV